MGIDRADQLPASTTLTGVDFIHVLPDQLILTVFLQHDTLPAGLAATLAAIAPADIHITADGPVAPSQVKVLQNVSPLPPPVDGRAVVQLVVEAPGGFGFYRLRIDSPAIDPFFNNIGFTFKAGCDSDLDCKAEGPDCPEPDCPEPDSVDFPVDYRARDFWSFRQALMDFASQRYPDWQDGIEADVGMMVLELLAALGDEFAYAQDRLSRESQLGSASQRRSVRHLARLVDYPLDDGSGAFAWLDVTAAAAVAVPAGTVVCDAQQQVLFEVGKGLKDRPLGVPLPPVAYAVTPARNELKAYIWDENDTCVLRGATTLELEGAHAVDLQPDPAIDPVGRWALLRTNPPTPDIPERRLAVRIVEAHDDTDPLLGVAITRIRWDQPTAVDLDRETLVLRGNLLPSSSGETHSATFRVGAPTSPADAGLPMAIERVGIDSTLCYPKPGSDEDEASRVKVLFSLEGSDVTPLAWYADAQADSRMAPEVELVRHGDGKWDWAPSLVGEEIADPEDKVFTLEDGVHRRVVGFERFGELTLLIDYASGEGQTVRFGDGEFGKAPPEGAVFTLRYRLGNGSRMNVAADTLLLLPAPVAGVASVTNPLAATGGRPRKPAADRTNAPRRSAPSPTAPCSRPTMPRSPSACRRSRRPAR